MYISFFVKQTKEEKKKKSEGKDKDKEDEARCVDNIVVKDTIK